MATTASDALWHLNLPRAARLWHHRRMRYPHLILPFLTWAIGMILMYDPATRYVGIALTCGGGVVLLTRMIR